MAITSNFFFAIFLFDEFCFGDLRPLTIELLSFVNKNLFDIQSCSTLLHKVHRFFNSANVKLIYIINRFFYAYFCQFCHINEGNLHSTLFTLHPFFKSFNFPHFHLCGTYFFTSFQFTLVLLLFLGAELLYESLCL